MGRRNPHPDFQDGVALFALDSLLQHPARLWTLWPPCTISRAFHGFLTLLCVTLACYLCLLCMDITRWIPRQISMTRSEKRAERGPGEHLSISFTISPSSPSLKIPFSHGYFCSAFCRSPGYEFVYVAAFSFLCGSYPISYQPRRLRPKLHSTQRLSQSLGEASGNNHPSDFYAFLPSPACFSKTFARKMLTTVIYSQAITRPFSNHRSAVILSSTRDHHAPITRLSESRTKTKGQQFLTGPPTFWLERARWNRHIGSSWSSLGKFCQTWMLMALLRP